MGVFSAGEALGFLNGRTGLTDESGAAAVAARLESLPLALALAAAVIPRQRLGYWTYLDQLRTLSVQEYLAPHGGESYPRGVAEAGLLSLEAVRTADRTGVCTGVMEMLAVMSAAGVHREFLYASGKVGMLAYGGRQVAAPVVDRAIEQLAERSLVTSSMSNQTISVHRLVARVIIDGLAREGRLAAIYRGAASVLEARAMALVGSKDRRVIREIPQQVASMVNDAYELEEELTGVLLRLRLWALYYLIKLGDSAPQAIAAGQSLTADLEQVLGPEHPDTLNARNSLATAYRSAGRATDAIPLFEQTLFARQRLLGPSDPDTLTSQNNLATAYRAAGRIGEAILLFQLTLAARERLLGADHPSTLNSRGNLAAAYRDAGRSAEAISLLEQNLAQRERALGVDHPDTIASRDDLAAAYEETRQASESGSPPDSAARVLAPITDDASSQAQNLLATDLQAREPEPGPPHDRLAEPSAAAVDEGPAVAVGEALGDSTSRELTPESAAHHNPEPGISRREQSV